MILGSTQVVEINQVTTILYMRVSMILGNIQVIEINQVTIT